LFDEQVVAVGESRLVFGRIQKTGVLRKRFPALFAEDGASCLFPRPHVR